MATPVQPLISIKAGKCTQSGSSIVPMAEPGLLYLYNSPEDELLHFCWKPRSAPDAEEDLIIFPSDARFVRYTQCTTGRVFVLKFSSSSQRHFFWLQSTSESPDGDIGFWSARDKRWGDRIDKILQGEEEDNDGDEEMGDVGLGSEDIEEEGSASRRGGEDGGRANLPAVSQQDFLQNLISQIQLPGSSGGGSGSGMQQQQQTPSISLHDLLSTQHTGNILDTITPSSFDSWISNLPPAIIPRNASDQAKKRIVNKILRSPQFTQSLVSLTVALRDGGLRGVADSLGVKLRDGEEGEGRDQVELFVEGVKRGVESEGVDGEMDVDS